MNGRHIASRTVSPTRAAEFLVQLRPMAVATVGVPLCRSTASGEGAVSSPSVMTSFSLKSDLVFEPAVLGRVLKTEHPNAALVDRYRFEMDGIGVTVVGSDVITHVTPSALHWRFFAVRAVSAPGATGGVDMSGLVGRD